MVQQMLWDSAKWREFGTVSVETPSAWGPIAPAVIASPVPKRGIIPWAEVRDRTRHRPARRAMYRRAVLGLGFTFISTLLLGLGVKR